MANKLTYQIDFSHPAHIYFIGIGGVSMSGLAHILHDKGFTVSGSDRRASSMTDDLSARGIRIFIGENAENILNPKTPIDAVIYTAAVHPDNPEYAACVAKGLPLLSRAQLLGQMMRFYKTSVAVAGTHGKTSTTSMISEILMTADADPTLLIGGIYPGIGSNIRIGQSDTLVTEACEYTNSFLDFYPTIGLILNVEADHLDFFKDLDDIFHSFHRFAKLLPKNGSLIIGGDIQRLNELVSDLTCPYYTFGLSDSYDYYANDIVYDEEGLPSFLIHVNKTGTSFPLKLSVPGAHNVKNAVAAFACADLMGIDADKILLGLSRFVGASRRFEVKGNWRGVTIVDDYAHHPTEISVTLSAAKRVPHKTLWCVFQPHTYTRTKALLREFAIALSKADHVVLLPIYAAREDDIYGISSADLRDRILSLGADCTLTDNFENVKSFLSENCTKGDLLITMGAGDVTIIGTELLDSDFST